MRRLCTPAAETRSPPLVAAIVMLSTCLACRGQEASTRAPVDGAPPSATPAIDESAPSDARELGEPSSRPQTTALPSATELVAPFRGKKAHGFVAMTAGAPGTGAARSIVPLASGDVVDEARPVLVASFTKLWTAIAALRMVARGELALDLAIKDVLPDLARRPWAKSTLGELLTHTSEVPEFDEKSGYYRRGDVDPSAPALAIARYVPADWKEKRGIYKYRNAELAIVGAILAARANATEEEVLAREVFGPAKMTHAGLLGRIVPARLDLAPMGAIRPQNFFTAGAGYASPADLLSFFEALDGKALLDETWKGRLFEGDARLGHASLGSWAYPFANGDAGATRMLERPGSFGNIRLFTAFFPDEHRAIVAFTADGIEIASPRTGRGVGVALARAALASPP